MPLQSHEHLVHVGEGAILSSKSPAPSARGVREPGVPKIVLPFGRFGLEKDRFRCGVPDFVRSK